MTGVVHRVPASRFPFTRIDLRYYRVLDDVIVNRDPDRKVRVNRED